MKELGIVVPIVTPCTPDGQVDVEGLNTVCDDMMQAGCHGVFVAGSTGRGPWFNQADRMKICETVAGNIRPEKPLLAGCMAAGLDEMLENAKIMGDSGATMAVATAPMYFPYSGDEVESIFLKFADASQLPVIIYDIPELAGVAIDPQLLMKLVTHENIVGFKDSSANYDNFKQLLDVLNETDPDFYLMQGKEHLLKDSLVAGASGLVVSLLHVTPEPFVALYNAVQQGDTEKADHMQQVITGIMECLKSCFEKKLAFSTLSHFLNVTLNERGIDVNIRLEHEGKCPDWIAAKAKEAIIIAENGKLFA
jgi:dihydrodipicolinate synthase/N-acetylneuraminate lyase